ncbi:peptidoglycan DD-metalloendopeptidase family protein, partial [Patescibacteria group bacterium]
LYYCTGAGAIPTLSQECESGCQVNDPGDPDQCIGGCPTGGLYCGGSVGEDPDNLYYCTTAGAEPTLNTTCSDGCQENPPGTPDECVISGCPGYGWWCGGSVGEDPNNLYKCDSTGATPQLEEACTNGCQENDPGVPDQCIGVGTCPGYGWWCGSSVGMNPDYLYYCESAGASPTLNEACSDGCQIMPPDEPDRCSGLSCPDYGWWCGESVGGNPNYLYYCTDAGATPQVNKICDNGCQINPPDVRDQCQTDGDCPGFGKWCGTSVGGDLDTLYYCAGTGNAPIVHEECSSGCKVNSIGTPDQCYSASGGTCPTDGWYCGVTVGLDINNLYLCTNGVAQVDEVCSNGCQLNPPGYEDNCIDVGTGFCASIPSGEWYGPGDYCIGDMFVTCTVNRDTVYQEYCGINRCQYNSPAMCIYDPVELPEGEEVLNPGGVSNLYWPFEDSSWNNKNGWVKVYGSEYHIHSEIYAQDWSWGNGIDDDCGKDFISPISGDVIFSGNGDHTGDHVVVRSDINPDMALLVGHLQSGSLTNETHVTAGLDVLGKVGKSGDTDNCHPHVTLYKNVSGQCGAESVLGRLTNGHSACWSNTTNAAQFEFNYRGPNPRTGFVFPVLYWQDHKIEKDFGFGGGPIDEWLDCYGYSTPNGGNKYHAGIDVISTDALGTNELTASIPEDIQACERGSLNSQVIAAGAGLVVEAGFVSSGEGYRVTIEHYVQEDGQVVYSTYMHIKYLYVSVGDIVKVGQPIGYVGDYSNNPHLHFELKKFGDWRGGYTASSNPKDEDYINPCEFIPRHGGSVPPTCTNMSSVGGSVSNLYSSALTSFTQNATNEDLLITMSNLEEPTVSVGSSNLIVNQAFDIKAQDTSGNLITNFFGDVVLEFNYFLNALRHVDVSTMIINYLDPNSSVWTPLPTTVDLQNQKVTAPTSHFTEFAVIGDYINYEPIITSEPDVFVYKGNLYEYDIEASDQDFDTLTYDLLQAPDLMEIDHNNGLVSWTPISGDMGFHDIVIGVSDSDSQSTQSFTLEVDEIPTAVILASFEAEKITIPGGYNVLVKWETGMELHMLGFNIYKTTDPEGTSWRKINDRIILSKNLGGVSGEIYEYLDEDLYEYGITYYMKLEIVELGGHTEESDIIEVRGFPNGEPE